MLSPFSMKSHHNSKPHDHISDNDAFLEDLCDGKIKLVTVMKTEGYGFLAEGATVKVWKWSDVACCPIATASLLVSCKSCSTNKHE